MVPVQLMKLQKDHEDRGGGFFLPGLSINQMDRLKHLTSKI